MDTANFLYLAASSVLPATVLIKALPLYSEALIISEILWFMVAAFQPSMFNAVVPGCVIIDLIKRL